MSPIDEPLSAPGECLNCGAHLGGRFCSDCGQRADSTRLRLKSWAVESLGAVTSLESRLPSTIVGLTQRPGKTARQYIDGKRVRFMNPVKYAFLAAGAWLLAFSISHHDVQDESGLVAHFIRYGQLINLAAIPLLAGAFHVSFLGSRSTYAEELCVASYLAGHTFLWRALLVVLGALGISSTALQVTDQWLLFGYAVWILGSFYSGRVRFIPLRLVAAIVGILIASVIASLPIAILVRR